MSAEYSLAKARALIGTPFRLHGRDEEGGLDCAGLIALVFDRHENVRADYNLRNQQGARWVAELDDHFIPRHQGSIESGDILLLRAGPAQFHLGIFTGTGLIHADARLRRVVETPGPLAWPIIGAWHDQKEI